MSLRDIVEHFRPALRNPWTWLMIVGLAGVGFYFGFHAGSN